MSLRVAEVFAGCGGLSLGLHEAGFTGVWAGEMFSHACDSYAANFPDVPLFRGKVVLGPGSLPDLDLLAGGVPCQPFSQAGAGMGQWDPRDGFPAYLRLVERFRPRALLIENVKGLTTVKHRPYLDRVCESLRELGYWVEWRVLNAADYGTPQKRQRMILVGFRDRVDAAAWSWPEPTHSLEALVYDKHVTGTYWREHGMAGPPVGTVTTAEEARVLRTLTEKPTSRRWRTVRDAIGDIVHLPADVLTPERVERVRAVKEKEQVLFPDSLDVPARTIDAQQGSGDARASEIVIRVPPNHDIASVMGRACNPHKNGRARVLSGQGYILPPDEPSQTVTMGMHTGVANAHAVDLKEWPGPPVLRRLTVRECARLQGFPDTFKLLGPKTAQYKQVGNAVPRELALAVGRAFARVLGRSA